MFRYKGVNIWYNSLQNLWMLQVGCDIIDTAKTIGAAKTKITRKYS